MANEILSGIAADMKEVDVAVHEAEDLLEAMKEAGESVTELETELRTLKLRKNKWENMLKSRGIQASR